MAWLYLPSIALKQATAEKACSDYPSAPGPEASISDCTSPSQAIELFVMSSGMPTPQPLSWRGWKTKPWIKRLSGTTLPPSTANRGAASWISCMAAIHASPSASPEENSATKTQDTSGLTSPVSSEKSNRRFASSKTSAGIYDWASNKRMMTFERWVIALRLACLQRKKSALPIDANDCSSWPTAVATDGEKGGPNSNHGNGTPHLAAAAVRTQWYTPDVPNGGRVRPADMSETGAMADGRKRQVGLENQARFVWPTPMANPNTNRQTKPTPSQIKGEHGLNLAMVAVQSSWPTPRTCAGKRSSGSNRTELVNSWATPMTRDWKDGAATSENVPTNSILGRQAPRSMNDGSGSTLSLNPLFVEWLMGWPIGWTDCVSAVTASSRWLRLMRSELSRVLLESKPAQADLFDF